MTRDDWWIVLIVLNHYVVFPLLRDWWRRWTRKQEARQQKQWREEARKAEEREIKAMYQEATKHADRVYVIRKFPR